MILEDVMDQVGDRLDTIAGLRVHKQPPDKLTPPAGVVSYPEMIEFDQTYVRGADKMILPVVIVEGRVSARATRKRLADYAAGAGAKSIKQVLEGGVYTAFHTITVQSVEFDVVTVAGVDYMAALFQCEIFGGGN